VPDDDWADDDDESESSSECSDEGVSDVDESSRQVASADLSQIQLDTLFDVVTTPTAYSTNGTSAKRIKQVIKTGCKCAKPCLKTVGVTSLNGACRGFWRLRKQAQDAVLWTLGRASVGRKRQWKLNGTIVCRKGFCMGLGIGHKRLVRVTRTFRGADMRGSTE
jgi:hypothetical protein